MLLQDSTYIAQLIETEEFYQEYGNLNQSNSTSGSVSDDTYTIPVVFHVLHLGEPYGQGSNVPDNELEDAVTSLNLTFSDINGNSVDTGISFCLASRDPEGEATDGINRIDASDLCEGGDCYSDVGAAAFLGNFLLENAMKNLSKWPKEDYINIWIVHDIHEAGASGSYGGYAIIPTTFLSASDGIVIDDTYLVDPFVVAHEMGHHLGLHHTFDSIEGGISGGCPLPPGDYVEDTDPHQRATGCPENNLNPCVPGETLQPVVYNYMSYLLQ